ncbi:MAG TPA: protein-glutamate O-methyltransferase [Rhizomicrobium sp.]|nr:protein-glutamate O-methyltransferase [Rhizomicrobium sp.]
MSDATDTWVVEAHHDVFENREFPFTERDFRKIATMVYEDAGISLSNVKAPLVYSRLVKRLRALGVENFKRYCALVEGGEGMVERHQMIDAITTNVTRFFREPHHFEHLKTKVLPHLIANVRRGARLRIWSAGCSSGEEPYSIALTVLSLMPEAPQHDVRILATDISRNMLEKGRAGIYNEATIAPVSRQMRSDWFQRERKPDGSKLWHVGEELRRLVAFRELNLMDEWPMRQAYHIIFCRNVTIYFEEDVQTQIINRLAARLAPGGHLYIGHSERVAHCDHRLLLDGNTVYRLARGETHA